MVLNASMGSPVFNKVKDHIIA